MAVKGINDETLKKINSTFTPSAEATAAKKTAADYSVNNDPTKISKYGAVSEQLLDQYLNRGEFKYDINTDRLYQQYKDQYTRNAQKAMKDSVAQSAAMTGGYANSWGQTAGQQVYQDYMTALDDKIPELQAQAYNQYVQEGNDLLNGYSAAAGHYQNELDNFRTDRAYYDSIYDKYYDRDYTQYTNDQNKALTLAGMENTDYWNQVNHDESVRQFEVSRADAQAAAAAEVSPGIEYTFAQMTTNENGEPVAMWYGSDGKEYFFDVGANPYTGKWNSDVHYGAETFGNGAQPSQISLRDENGDIITDEEGNRKFYDLHKTGITGELNGQMGDIYKVVGVSESLYVMFNWETGTYEAVDPELVETAQ